MKGQSGIIGLVRSNNVVVDVPPDVLKDFIKHRYVNKEGSRDDVTIYRISNGGRKAAAKEAPITG